METDPQPLEERVLREAVIACPAIYYVDYGAESLLREIKRAQRRCNRN